ncbi:TPA: O-antigen polymerase [Vibrio vulnificus]
MLFLPEKRIYTIVFLWFIISFFFLVLIPAESKVPNLPGLVLINLVFIMGSVFFSMIASRIPIGFSREFKEKLNYEQLKKSTIIFSLISLFGFFFMAYDRFFIRAINYAEGLRSARYEWLSSEGGSIYSILGNILVPFGYYCLVLLFVNFSRINFSYKLILSISSIFCIFGHAALNGGRSNLIIGVCLCMVIYICKNRKFIMTRKFFFYVFVFLLVAISSVLYSVNIISSSAELGNITLRDITYMAINELYGNVTAEFYDVDYEFQYLFYYMAAYLFHGGWTAQIAMSLDNLPGSYALYPISVVLSQAGVLSSPLEPGYFSMYGAFISMPGALYYDFGYVGLVISSFFLGGGLGVVIRLISTGGKIDGFKFSFITYILFIYFLWPILPGYGFSYINFIVFGFILVEIINRAVFRKSFCWF